MGKRCPNCKRYLILAIGFDGWYYVCECGFTQKAASQQKPKKEKK